MRQFIVSDIHGFANLYYSIMHYLDNISKSEEIELYINGDLIGYQSKDSADILLDVMKRIGEYNPQFHITYLGGDQEYLMGRAFYNLGEDGNGNNWYHNGGRAIFANLGDRKAREDVRDFIYNLSVYQKLKTRLDGKKIILVHAARPFSGSNNLKIGEMGNKVYYTVTGKKSCPCLFPVKKKNSENEITILGHVPTCDEKGFNYDVNERILRIDGGASKYLEGHKEYNHFPLVELTPSFFRILTFNDENNITSGYYLGVDNFMRELDPDELEKAKSYIKM